MQRLGLGPAFGARAEGTADRRRVAPPPGSRTEKHLDFGSNTILVRQRYYRGDLDETKNDNSRRDAPMGYLAIDSMVGLCRLELLRMLRRRTAALGRHDSFRYRRQLT